MASRRMKIKVMANVGRLGRTGPEQRSATPTPESYHNLASPGSPTKTVHFSLKQESKDSISYPLVPSPNVDHDFTACQSQQGTQSPIAAPLSPTSPHPSMSPEYKSGYKSQHSPHFLAPKSPGKARSCSPTKSPGPTPIHVPVSYVEHQPRSPTKFHPTSETRGPGRGPAANATSSNVVMSNLQKEIGAVNVANMNSNETLRQRLQKGSSLNPTTKYATIRKEFLSKYGQCGDKRPDKSELTILHFTFWNPPKMPEDNMNDEKLSTKEENMIRAFEDNLGSGSNERRNSAEDELENKSTGPRVKVGPDGELIIDEKSLVIETSESQRAKKQLDEMETVSGAGFAVGSSGYYRHKRQPKRGFDWTVKETVKFYRALTACGTDFSMMCEIFGNRSRAELKAKFKREDRRNPVQISQALSCQSFGPMEEFADSEDEAPQAPTEEFSLPPSKKARRKSLNEKAVNVNEEVSKAVGATIVGESPGLEAYLRQTKKVKKVKEPKLEFKKGRPRKLMNQKLSFVPVLRNESVGEPSLYPTSIGKPSIDTESYFSFSAPFGQFSISTTDKPIPLPPCIDFTPPPTSALPKPKKVAKEKRKKKPKPDKIVKEKREKKAKPEKTAKKKRMKESNPDPDVEPKIKKKRNKIPKLKKAKDRKRKSKALPPDHWDSNPCPEILRFDPTDPLGFKVVHSVPADVRNDEVNNPNVIVEPEPMPRLVLVGAPDSEVSEETEISMEESIPVPCDNVVSRAVNNSPPRNTRRSRNLKIKPKLRVPTGGDMEKNRQNTSIADEIEIEISCL